MLQINDLNIPIHPKNHSLPRPRGSDIYSAQALLTAYYNEEFLIPNETDQGIGYRSKSNSIQSIDEAKSSLIFTPGMVNDQLNVIVKLKKPATEFILTISFGDGEALSINCD